MDPFAREREKNVFGTRATLLAVQSIVALDYACVGAVRTVLPYYARALGASAMDIGALETVYGIGQVVGSLLMGRLSDKRGRRTVLSVSFFGSCLGYLTVALGVLEGSSRLLLLSRLPVGLAKQTITASRALVGDITSADERTSAMSR